MGGRLSGFSGYDSFGLSATFFSRNFKEGLRLLADIYTDVIFSRRQGRTGTGVDPESDQDGAGSSDAVYDQRSRPDVFPEHPYGFDKEGTLASVAGFTVEDLKQTYAHFAIPSNMVLTIVGDMDAKKSHESN